MSTPEIDIVVTWVDNTDPEWQAAYTRYAKPGEHMKNSVSETRFRDYGLLRYWFRGIERFLPWVRRIHFVTSCRPPQWLDTSNPRLHVVRHEEYIPAQFLPTFNSVVIERYMHRIPGLADRFIYFNDDFYALRPISPDRFFRDGLPCDIATFQYSPSWSQWYVRIKNNIRLLNRHFDKRSVLRAHPEQWYNSGYGGRVLWNHLLRPYGRFITLCAPHNAQPYLRQTFLDVWQACGDELTATSVNRFRALDDYTPELMRAWQIAQGRFVPYNTYRDTKMFPLMLKSERAIRAIREQAYALVCLNDNKAIRNYDEVMARLDDAFRHILPHPSSFELS